MMKNFTRIECIVNEKTGYFFCDMDTPIPVAKEMIFQFQKYVGLIEDQINAATQKEEEPVTDIVVEEEE